MVFGHFWTILPPLEGELFTKIWEIKNFKTQILEIFLIKKNSLWLKESYLKFSGRCDGLIC